MEFKQMSGTIPNEWKGIKDVKVLVVEDDKTNQKVITCYLEMAGMQITLSENGIEAINELKMSKFDIVLMDLQMPIMDGITATSIIRRLEANTKNHIPIVALTAYSASSDKQKCLEAGMDDFLTKPINMDNLVKTIKKWAITS